MSHRLPLTILVFLTIAVLGPLVLTTDFSGPTLVIIFLCAVLGVGIALLSDFADLTSDAQENRISPISGDRQSSKSSCYVIAACFITAVKLVLARTRLNSIKGAAPKPQPY